MLMQPIAAGAPVDRGPGQASAQRAFDEAVDFTTERKAFGKRILDFQNTRFTLADLKTKLQVGWAHLDWAIAPPRRRQADPGRGAARPSCGTPSCNGRPATPRSSSTAARAI